MMTREQTVEALSDMENSVSFIHRCALSRKVNDTDAALRARYEELDRTHEHELAACEHERDALHLQLSALTQAHQQAVEERDEARSAQIAVLRSFNYLAAGLRNGVWNQALRANLLNEVDRLDESLLTTAKQQYATLQTQLQQAVEALRYIAEYWNGHYNERAMTDYCNMARDTAEHTLAVLATHKEKG